MGKTDRFAVFAGIAYYPGGGASTLIGWAGSPDEGWLLVDTQSTAEWCHILDCETGQVISRDDWPLNGHGDPFNLLADWP